MRVAWSEAASIDGGLNRYYRYSCLDPNEIGVASLPRYGSNGLSKFPSITTESARLNPKRVADLHVGGPCIHHDLTYWRQC